MCGLSVEALKRDGVNKRPNASMDKSFDGMHEKYDFDSIRCSVKKTISISMIVTSVLNKPSGAQDIIFASTGYLLVHRRGRIMYYLVDFKRI